MTEGQHEVQAYNKGERVFCYEPDKSKARVLYTSKVLNVTERKDENGLRYYEYMIHFQGWRRSYDRNVRASSLLKDTEENRQFQRELAEAARLQTRGSYSYKGTPSQQPHAKKKRLRRGAGQGDEAGSGTDPLDISQEDYAEPEAPAAHKFKLPSGDSGGGGGAATTGTNLDKSDAAMRNKRARFDPPTSRPPRAKPMEIVDIDVMERFKYQEDRVMLLISERLREYMEYDYNMVVKLNKQHAMPARIPIVTILENFVKQRAVELAISIKQDSSRARNTQSRSARMEREYDRVMSKVCLLKEVVDGIRIYFEFHVDQHLLYKQEKKYTNSYLTDDNLKNCSIVLNNSYDYINPSCEPELDTDGTPIPAGAGGGSGSEGILGNVGYQKQLEKCLLYIVKTMDKKSAQAYGSSPYDAAYKLPIEMRGFLCETFNWRLLSPESPPEKSMVFGAPHLARLMIKLPECLNASPISNEKLEDLLPHLDSFINYLENHKEWFDRQNYAHFVSPDEKLLKRPTSTATATKISSQV
ncbi:uncharacterized protein Dwil_GK17539 [Drosophila willistoni]|uniref:Protein male-specific lethal-3 n=1 Tax=Drosophila willistoni TaxID=7260 RepID=B4MMM4_DROWI|nr:protein male-specific lethal-3 [Drosophila willistoni]EDW73430.1 uncharacterized protein Dwil_GK17539 [Drosophila willistoni]